MVVVVCREEWSRWSSASSSTGAGHVLRDGSRRSLV